VSAFAEVRAFVLGSVVLAGDAGDVIRGDPRGGGTDAQHDGLARIVRVLRGSFEPPGRESATDPGGLRAERPGHEQQATITVR